MALLTTISTAYQISLGESFTFCSYYQNNKVLFSALHSDTFVSLLVWFKTLVPIWQTPITKVSPVSVLTLAPSIFQDR